MTGGRQQRYWVQKMKRFYKKEKFVRDTLTIHTLVACQYGIQK